MGDTWPRRRYIISDGAIQNPEQEDIQNLEETDNSFGTKSALKRDRRWEGTNKTSKKDKSKKNMTQSRPKYSQKLEFG
jgi:hypothetical protein